MPRRWPRPGERVLDTCASPGGKSVAMAAAVGPDGLVVAGDVRGRRIDLLRQTLTRAGAERASVVQIDLSGPLPFGPVFDCVFVDAPCSGLGTIRREPEIRWRRASGGSCLRSPRRSCACSGMQPRPSRPGGRLVYATCSSEPEENEAVVAAFLARSPRVHAAGRAASAATGCPTAMGDLIDDAGHLRSWPWQHGLEAFFGAVMVRR